MPVDKEMEKIIKEIPEMSTVALRNMANLSESVSHVYSRMGFSDFETYIEKYRREIQRELKARFQ